MSIETGVKDKEQRRAEREAREEVRLEKAQLYATANGLKGADTLTKREHMATLLLASLVQGRDALNWTELEEGQLVETACYLTADLLEMLATMEPAVHRAILAQLNSDANKAQKI